MEGGLDDLVFTWIHSLFFMAWVFFFMGAFTVVAALFVSVLILWDKYQEKYWFSSSRVRSGRSRRRIDV